MNRTRYIHTILMLIALSATLASCNNSSGSSGSAAFGGSTAAKSTDEIVQAYTQETTKPGGEVTVQGMRKVKLDNLCKVLAKVSDNNPVQLTPSKWRTTRGFFITHSTELNFFCSKYANLGDLFDAINLDPKLIHKEDLRASISSIADVMNGADVTSGPKKILSTSPVGPCDSTISSTTSPVGGGDTKATIAATTGMSACGPGLVIGILLMNADPSSINSNLTAAGVACLALYANLLKKNNIGLPQGAQSSAGSSSCKKDPNKAGANGSAGGGNTGGGDASDGDTSGG